MLGGPMTPLIIMSCSFGVWKCHGAQASDGGKDSPGLKEPHHSVRLLQARQESLAPAQRPDGPASRNVSDCEAGPAGIEPATPGFGDRCSTN